MYLNAGMGAPVAGQANFKPQMLTLSKDLCQLLILFSKDLCQILPLKQPFVLAEPIGGATPKFMSDSKHLGTFVKREGGNLALLCPAQAMPLPTFRLVAL